MLGEVMNLSKKRIYQIDIIKVIALYRVISVHFIRFMSGWLLKMQSPARIIAIALFLISDCCVPLFTMCSGYLLAERKASWKGHYQKLLKILAMYLMAFLFAEFTKE